MLWAGIDILHSPLRNLLGRRDEHCRGVWPMLGLKNKIGSDSQGVSMLISHDQGLSRAGDNIDTDGSVELAFGFGNESIAWAGNEVDLDHCFSSREMAVTACTRPKMKISSQPARCIAATVAFGILPAM